MESQNQINTTTNDFPIGSTVFGKYEILNFIASGGNGRVYKVLDTLRKVDVALKVLPHESIDDKQLMRFQTEAQTASKLQHSNIATIYDFGMVDGTPYLVMEFVEGLSLEEMLAENKRLDLPVFLDIFIQITEAVTHAHHNGVVHRDLKPANVVIREDAGGAMTAKILDFGVAKQLDTNEKQTGKQKQTPTGNIVGSPFYMSPEQARGMKVTPQSDWYSIGSMMFRCLTGYPPIQADTAIETIMRVANVPAPSLAEQPDVHVPVELSELVDGLLSKVPEQRPSLEETVLPTLRDLKSCELTEAVEEEVHGEGTISNTTPSLANVQLLSLTGITITGALLIVIIGGAIMVLHLSDSRKSKPPEKLASPRSLFHGLPRLTSKHEQGLKAPHIKVNSKDIYDKDLELVDQPETVLTLTANGTYLRTLASISRFPKLEEVEVNEAEISDPALEQLTKLKHLRRLYLRSNTEITDKGMESIAKLTKLTDLDLSETPKISGIGLKKLNTLKLLKKLHLEHSSLSPSDVKEFAASISPGGQIALNDSPKINDADLEKLRKKFPDIVFNGRPSVVDEMSRPLEKLMSPQLVRTAAQNQKLKDLYQSTITVIETAYGNETLRSRNYYINMADFMAFAEPGDPKNTTACRIAAYQTALEKSRKAADLECQSLSLDSIASCLLGLRGYQGGKSTALRAIRLADSLHKGPNPKQVARLAVLGLHAKSANQFTEAVDYYKRALAIEENLSGKDSRVIGVLTGSLGDCYMMTKNYTAANACYKKVIQIFNDQGPQTESERNAYLMAYGHRAHLLMQDNRPAEALAFHKEFYRLAMKPGSLVMYGVGALKQRIDLFTMLKHKPAEIDALQTEYVRLAEKEKTQPRF